MNRDKLERVADELRCNVDNCFDVAMLTIVETLADLDEGDNVSWSLGNIGINVTKNSIELVDINASRAILSLEVKYEA